MNNQAGTISELADGAGLCSPGRWAPEDRLWEKSGFAVTLRSALLKHLGEQLDVKKTHVRAGMQKALRISLQPRHGSIRQCTATNKIQHEQFQILKKINR